MNKSEIILSVLIRVFFCSVIVVVFGIILLDDLNEFAIVIGAIILFIAMMVDVHLSWVSFKKKSKGLEKSLRSE